MTRRRRMSESHTLLSYRADSLTWHRPKEPGLASLPDGRVYLDRYGSMESGHTNIAFATGFEVCRHHGCTCGKCLSSSSRVRDTGRVGEESPRKSSEKADFGRDGGH